MIYYAIRERSTKLFLPQRKNSHSWAEPEANCVPWLFPNHHAAACAMRAWVKGRYSMASGGQDWEGNYDDPELMVAPVPGRDIDKMEVVEVHLEVPIYNH